MVSQAMDFHTDSACCRARDPDMTLGCSLGLDVTMTLGAAQVTQISMAPAAGWPSENLASNAGTDHDYLSALH